MNAVANIVPDRAVRLICLLYVTLTISGCGQPASANSVAASTSIAVAKELSSNTRLPTPQPTPPIAPPATFGAAADAAAALVEHNLYLAPGRWNVCIPNVCGSAFRDWGADSLTYTLFLRWTVAHDAAIAPIMAQIAQYASNYDSCVLGSCTEWSDVPLWDSVAAARAYEITRAPLALTKAKNAFAFVDKSNAFALGACPAINYQRPGGLTMPLKTLETDSNYIKAALLLQQWTGDRTYLTKAIAKYAAVRRYFLDPVLPLYTVYVVDNGTTCTQIPHRFFASVNGNMIFNGLALSYRTGDATYLNDALATGLAVARDLNDADGIFADLQAENDIVEPLVEAAYALASRQHSALARSWILANAAASTPAANGAYGRFFAGPPPAGVESMWAANGGLALAIAAGALDRAGSRPSTDYWSNAVYTADPVASAPATITFTGRAIALIGTIGEVCCEAGHARVSIDGHETVDGTGIWQNKSSSGRALPNSVLFSWRWPASGRHTISLEPGIADVKEGGSYIHLAGYDVVP